MGFGGHIFELPASQVVVKSVLRAWESPRAAHHRHSFPYAGGTLTRLRRSRQIEIHVIRYHQIDHPVAIIVDKGATGAPGLAGTVNSGLLCNLSENAVFVVIEPV